MLCAVPRRRGVGFHCKASVVTEAGRGDAGERCRGGQRRARCGRRLLRHAPVVRRDEGHLGHLGRDHLLARAELHVRALLGKGGVHVAHGHGLAKRRTARAGSHDADLLAFHVEDGGALADGLGVAHEPDALLRLRERPAVGLEDVVRTGEPLFHAASRALGPYRPQKPGLDGINRSVEVVAVEAQARLEAQRVARAKAARLHVRGRRPEQHARQLLRVGVLHRNLKAVLARVAAPRHARLEAALEGDVLTGHEGHLLELEAGGEERGHDVLGAVALEGEQLLRVTQVVARHVVARVRLLHLGHVRQIAVLAGAIHDHVDVVARVGEDGVVDDAAFRVDEKGQFAFLFLKAPDIPDEHALQELDAVLARPLDLAHVRHVEQRRAVLRPAVQVLLQHAVAFVLHGQLVARKGHELAAELVVQAVERRAHQRLGRRRELAALAEHV
mmetsp:Transcript_12125/g.40458  ORF Transcript_12125/g.40458 Transcript_12125/m.40458 type:complete len:444 (-) Transcript_12125:49-1380(-)